jgi:hypothetical protein
MSRSIRELGSSRPGGKETPQFAEGTTIDGNRLDISMEDLVYSVNNIPGRWLRRRFVHSQFVQRLMPVPYGQVLQQDRPPFLLARNLLSQSYGLTTPLEIQNEWRLKGSDVPGILASSYAENLDGVYAWTAAHRFYQPVIITGLSLKCWQPQVYAWKNDWEYHSDAPYNKNAGDSVDDLFLEISVDNPFNTEARRLNDIELHKIKFPVKTEFMAASLGNPVNDMFYPVLAPKTNQLWVHLDNLCIPLHIDTRARVSIAIPKYSLAEGDVSGWQTDGVDTWYPWQSCSWALTLTVLEPLGEI